MSEIYNPIKDNELDKLFQKDYQEEVEYKISETSIGKKIKALEKLRLGISLKNAAKRYLEIVGVTADFTGEVILEEDNLNILYQETVSVVLQETGIDISNYQISEVVQLTREIEGGKNPEEIKAELEIKKVFESMQEELKYQSEVFGFIDSNDIEILLKGSLRTGLSEDEIHRMIKEYDSKEVKNNIETQDDVDLFRMAYDLKFCIESEEYAELVPLYLREIEKLRGKSKFFDRLLGKDGKVSLEKLIDFIDEFETERNDAKLYTKATKLAVYGPEDIDEEKSEEIAKVLALVTETKDENLKKIVLELAKKLELGVLNESGEEFNIDAINQYFEKVYGPGITLQKVLNKTQFNKYTAIDRLDEIENDIAIEGPNKSANRSEILKRRERSKKREERICSKREKIIFDVLNSVNAGNIKNNLYENEEFAQNVVALYCKFREDEISRNKKSFLGLTGRSFNSESERSNSAIVRKFMQENSHCFEKYLVDLDKVDYVKAIDMLQTETMGKNQFSNFFIAYKQITSRTRSIVKDEKDNAEKMTNITNLMMDIKRAKKENDEIDLEKVGEIFELAKGIPKSVFSTEMLVELKELDPEQFKKTFKPRIIGTSTIESAYYAAARFFTKIPVLIGSSKSTINKYMPKVKETKRLAKAQDKKEGKEFEPYESPREPGVRGMLKRIFLRNKTKALPQAKGNEVASSGAQLEDRFTQYDTGGFKGGVSEIKKQEGTNPAAQVIEDELKNPDYTL